VLPYLARSSLEGECKNSRLVGIEHEGVSSPIVWALHTMKTFVELVLANALLVDE
jgi:hypothetical protein